MNRNRKQVYVRRKWDSPVDKLAYALTYRQWKGGYFEARREWNKTVTKWSSEGALGEFERMRLLSCRVRGVTLSKPSPKYSCHHQFCPSCRYSWTSKLLRRFPSWMTEGPLDTIIWQSPVRKEAVMDDISASQHRHNPCSVMRNAINKHLAQTQRAEWFHTSRMFVTFDEHNRISYFHQSIAIGRGFPPPRSASGLLGATYTCSYNEARAAGVLSALKYCKSWLQLPFEIGARVADWNKTCRTRVHDSRPSTPATS